ncbi:MAG: hypothetical protein GX216_06950 [Methanomicrobiales archaeon]|nr:hypothetical protein [Methanomicrobiales archaeon]
MKRAVGQPKILHSGTTSQRDAIPDVPVQSSPGHHADLTAGQVLQVLNDVIGETPSRLEPGEGALRSFLVPGH